MKRKRNKSQIATIIMFIMAVVFLFTLISLNIGRVAQKKTIVDNVADGVGLQLASQLGSIAKSMKHEVEMYDEGNPEEKTEKCNINIMLIVGGALVIIVATVIGIFTFGTGAIPVASLGFSTLVGMGVIGLGMGISGGVTQYQTAQAQVQALDALKTKFKNLDSLQRIIETPAQGVLFALHEDTAMVKDTFDMDRDKDTQDEIPRFLKWYNLRLNSFPRAGSLVENFYSKGFPPKDVYSPNIEAFFMDKNGQPRFYIDDDENLMAKKGDDAVRWWVDSNNDNQRDLKLVPWLKDELRTMLTTMRQYGYGINYRYVKDGFVIDDSATNYYEAQAIDDWVRELEEFENVMVRNLHNIDFDSAVGALDVWLPLLRDDKNRNGLADDDDWYTRLAGWETRLDELIGKDEWIKGVLNTRKKQIHDCIEPCERRAPGCCGGEDQWDCCKEECVHLQQPVDTKVFLLAYNKEGLRSAYDSGGGILSPNGSWTLAQNGDGNGGEEGNGNGNGDGKGDKEPEAESCTPTCVEWYGCCGDPKDCGQLCNDDHCKPKYTCHPPLGPARWCCEVLPLESSSECSNQPEYTNIVDRYNAITILGQFRNDIHQLRDLIAKFSADVETMHRESYDKMHEAFYIWSDYVGGTGSEKQEVGHVVYVNITGINPAEGFKIPHLVPKVKWLPPSNCVVLENGQGDFTLRVARFDEGTSKTGPLSRFWKFRFSRGTADEDFVRKQAKAFKEAIDNNNYLEMSEADKSKLRTLLGNSAVVSKVKVHYGPGRTEKDQESVPAKDRNKDIYIMETSSKM